MYNGNPFTPGRVVPPDRFIGRTDLIRDIVSRIETRGSLSLVGEARMGKSSLLQYLAANLESELVPPDGSRFIPIYLDMEICYAPSHFYSDVVTNILPYLPTTPITQAFISQWKQYLAQHHNWQFQEFNAVVKTASDYKVVPVLLIDEFRNAVEGTQTFSPQFFSGVRSLYQNGIVVLLIATRQPLDQIPDLNLYFANGLLTYNLSKFTPIESRLLLSQPHNRLFDPKAIDKGLEVADHYPLRIQLVGNYLYHHHDEIILNGNLHPNAFNKISGAINPQFENIERYSQQKFVKRNWLGLSKGVTDSLDKAATIGGRIQIVIYMVIGGIAIFCILAYISGWLTSEQLQIIFDQFP